MSMPAYQDVPVKVPKSLDTSQLKGKSVLVTGGASGLGQAYAQAFAKNGAYVTVVDLDKDAGLATVKEFESNAQFVKCDVTDWDQLVQAFEAAVQDSPNKGLDVVIANAGIISQDDMFTLEDPSEPPKKPNLKTMDVNLTGVLYTVKLAFHYFRRQPLDATRDRCLILKSSLAGYVDLPGSVQYNSSKFGVRGLFRSLRRTSWKQGIRVNLVAPWYIRTPIMSPEIQEHLAGQGVDFALVEDACKAMLLFAADRKINGRALGVVSRKSNADGIVDLELDDYPQGSMYYGWQKTILDTAGVLQD